MILTICIVCCNKIQSQVYYDRWAPVGAIWLFDYYPGLSSPPYATFWPLAYKVVKDTSIEGNLAKIIYELSLGSVLDQYGRFKENAKLDSIKNFIDRRHILINKKDSIYYLDFVTKSFIFLYKFNTTPSEKYEINRKFRDTIIGSDTIKHCIKSIVDTMIISSLVDEKSYNPLYKLKKYGYQYSRKLLEDNKIVLNNIGSMSYLDPFYSTISKSFNDSVNKLVSSLKCSGLPYHRHLDEHFNSIPRTYLECYFDPDTSRGLIANYSYYFDCSKLFGEKTNSIKEFKTVEFKIYPNPVDDVINFAFEKSLEVSSFEIYSLKGELIKSAKVSNTNQVDVQELIEGIYFLIIKDNKYNSIKKFKFIKK